MINPWFKFYGSEYLSDPKIGALSAQERSCWITLLCISSSASTGGTIQYLTVEVLLQKSGIQFDPYHPEEWNAALSILTKLENMKMIKTKEDGSIEIVNWVKRQETALTNAERQAKHRQNKKSNENVTEDVTEVTLEENRKEENRVESKKPLKLPYGEFKNVKLTDEEYGKLIERMGEANTHILIAELDTYVASKGKKYSSHYATILGWARRKVIELKDRKNVTKNKVAF